ncbi:MAG: hypothetical protein ACR65Z_12205 [Methylocystis sp.]
MKKPIVVIAGLALAIAAPAALAEDQQTQQQEEGVTSGPASGAPVEPSGSVQKDNPKAVEVNDSGLSGPSGASAGAPAVEGKKGTQSGQEWTPPEEIRGKKAPSS